MDPLTLAPIERPASACQGLDVDPAWWETDDPVDVARAVAVCRRCPEAQECLIWALKTFRRQPRRRWPGRQSVRVLRGPGVYGGFFFQAPNWRALARRAS